MKYVKIAVTMALIAVLVVLLFYGISNRKQTTTEQTSTSTAITKIVNMDLDGEDYPLTPRSVVSLFTDIQKCYYNYSPTDDEILLLATQARKLFDTELADANPLDEYVESVKNDIAAYEKNGTYISRVIIESSSDITYVTYDGIDNALVDVIYYTKDGSSTTKTYETYLLRKDGEGLWKIYGFKITDSE